MSNYNPTIKSLSPEIWFKFDEASGTPVNSGNSTNCAISTTAGSPTVNQIGIINKSTLFDGNDGYRLDTGSLNSNVFADGTFSIEAWVKTSSTSGIQEIFQMDVSTNSNATYDAGWALRLDQGKPNTYYIGKSGTTFTSLTHASSIADGNWHHLVMTVQTTSGNYDLKLYVDGTISQSDLSNSTTAPGSNADGTTYARKRIGYSLNDTEYLIGNIEQLAIYSTALTSTNISDNYNIGSYKFGKAYDHWVSTTQSSSNAWQYFYTNDTRTTATLYSAYSTSGNELVGNEPQWDNNQNYLSNYPYVQRVTAPNTNAPSGEFRDSFNSTPNLLLHPADKTPNQYTAVAWKNTTGASVTVSGTVTLKVANPSNNYDGIDWWLQRELVNGTNYSLLSSGNIDNGVSTTTTYNFNNVTIASGDRLFLIVGNFEYYNYDATIVTFEVNRVASVTADPMLTASPHATFPEPTISAGTPISYSSEALTATSDLVMPDFDTSSPINVDASPFTASADSVTPTLSLDTVSDAFGVATASSDAVHPTVSLTANIDYSHSVATASALMTAATATVTTAVTYSAAPATASALLGGNVYAGKTVQDTSYTLSIRKIGETVNADGKQGFPLGSQWSDSTLDARNSVAIKPLSGVPSDGLLIKAKFDPAQVTIYNASANVGNRYNIYVFTANPSTTFDTMNYTNLPAKELLYTTRSNDADGYYLDLTTAFRDSRAASYGIFIEHVGEPPYTSTQYDRIEYSGSDLDNKLLYILSSDFVSVNYNAPAATASAEMTAATVDTQKYVDYSHSVATASADIVNPTVIAEITVTVSVLELSASVDIVTPAFSGGTGYTSDHLEAHSEMLSFIVSTTRNINILVDASTISAELHMPQAQIGDEALVDHMSASALFVMPTIVIPLSVQALTTTATADIVDPTTGGQLLGAVLASPMTASAFSLDSTNSFNLLSDTWYSRLNISHDAQSGAFAKPYIKWMRQTTNLGAGSTFTADRSYTSPLGSFQPSTFTASTPFTNLETPLLEIGYFDNQNRKAVRFRNIAYQVNPGANQPAQVGATPTYGAYTIEMMFKTSKANQEIFYHESSVSQSSTGNIVSRIGVYGGKFYVMQAQVGSNFNDVVPWNSTYGKGSEFYIEGFKNIADDQWHHVLIQYGGSPTRMQVWIDGKLDFQKYNAGMTRWPSLFGGNSSDARGTADFYISGISFLPNTFLSERNITLNYSAALGFKTVEPEVMTANLTMTQDNNARGNRPRALALYWWPQKQGSVISRQSDIFDSQSTFGTGIEFDYPTFFQNLDTYQSRSQKFFGWDVYTVDVTGEYASEVVKPEAYSGGVRTFNELIAFGPGQRTVTKSGRGFRDPVTDNRRYLDIFNDIDLDQVEAIFFYNYPNESREIDIFARDEEVDAFFNIQEKQLYDQFLVGLRKAVDAGVNLFISNSKLALDLGIVDRVEIVDPLIDGLTFGPSKTGMPESIISVDDYNDDKERALDIVPLSGSKQDPIEGRWHDLSYNNRLRIRNTLPEVTDVILFSQDDAAYYVPDGSRNFGAPPELYTRVKYYPNGMQVGDEMIISDAAGDLYNKPRYLAVPFENVKAGKIIASFGESYKRKNTTVANPYANYATHIALEPGTVLQGKPIGGKIWVSLTERPQLSENNYTLVELSSDYWINLAFSLNVITEDEKNTYLNRQQNLDRQLAAGTLSQAEYDKITYWSELGYNQTTSVASGLKSQLDQAVEALGDIFQRIFDTKLKTQFDENTRKRLPDSLFNYSGTGIVAMVRNYYVEPRIVFPAPTLNGAAFGWLAFKEEAAGVIRDVAGTAQATIVQPTVVGDKIVSINAQAMIASATQADPTNIIWTQKDINIVSLPMLATATITPKLTQINADPLTASADMRQNVSAYVAQVDEVVLYINHVDPILYLREDIVK